MSKDFEELATLLAKEQQQLQAQQDVLNRLKQKFEEENETQFKVIEQMSESVAVIKQKLNTVALQKYEKTKEKTLGFGLKIREMTKVQYEEDAVLPWIKENMPVAIYETIDKKMFEKYAKDNKVPNVEITKNVIVTYPRQIKLEEDTKNE